MYCPVCFNDTLKVASSGVVRLTFNGKSKSTSQFFYNLKQEKHEEILRKFKEAMQDYFSYYSNFQNKSPITNIELTSGDFKCVQGCKIEMQTKLSVVNLVITTKEVQDTASVLGQKFSVPVDFET